MKQRKVLTSGEIAKYCDVTLRTAIRWIERGHLKAYKLPGRGNNRIQVADFIDFLKENKMPIPEEFQEQNTRILIVDDDLSVAKALSRIIRSLGYEYKIVTDGFQAGLELAKFNPQLITLDLMMPKMNGFEVLSYIRQSGFTATKVLVLSSAGNEALEKAKTLGADAALDKPYDNNEIKEVIQRLLGDSNSD